MCDGAPMIQDTRIKTIQYSLVILVILIFELGTRGDLISQTILVPPSEMVLVLLQKIIEGIFVEHLWPTLYSIFIAFILSVLIGVPLGVLLWVQEDIHQVLDPYLVAIYAIPIFALYPVLIAMFGPGRIPIALIGFLTSVPIVVVNTANSFNNISETLIYVGRSLRLSRRQAFRHLYFPAAIPYLFTGFKLGFVYSMLSVLASEFILSQNGIGYLISYNYNTFNTADMYAYILFVVIMAVSFNLSLLSLESRLQRHTKQ
jgi:NitT/TauT family transport system permease protein